MDVKAKTISRTVVETITYDVLVTFQDPLFPDKIIKFRRKYRRVDGRLKAFDPGGAVFSMLQNRYYRLIGDGWCCVNVKDDYDPYSTTKRLLRGKELKTKTKLVDERLKAIKKTCGEVTKLVRAALNSPLRRW